VRNVLKKFEKVNTEFYPYKLLRELSSKTAESWRLGGWEARRIDRFAQGERQTMNGTSPHTPPGEQPSNFQK
jgi:hypothetical protein